MRVEIFYFESLGELERHVNSWLEKRDGLKFEIIDIKYQASRQYAQGPGYVETFSAMIIYKLI